MLDDEIGERVTARFRMRLGESSFDAEARVPSGPTPVAALLPVVQPLADAVVAAAVGGAEAEGARISCGPGCGACCRQPVPIAEAEARGLVEMVAGFEPLRRRRIEERFDAAVQMLERAGLAEPLRDLGKVPDVAARQALGRRYFDLGIACPFLEDESCSIHGDRPLACREYLVTSDAAHCADPDAHHVDMLQMPVRASKVLFRLREGRVQPEARSVVLAFAREWWAAHPDADPPSAPGPQLLESFVRGLAGEGA